MSVKMVKIPFTPHVFQREAREKTARFYVLVCHRRWGKTIFAVMELILAALSTSRRDFRGGYIAPYRKQAKDIAWDYFKRFTGSIPGVEYNETELAVSFPNGARITLYGADNADALRGLYFDYVVMDEVADMKPFVWGEIVRPALADRKGRCLFIGTPKGMNLFFELYNRGSSGEKGWTALVFRASDTVNILPWIDDEELENARRDLTDAQYRQEFECDFNASCDNTLIMLDLIYKARGRHIPEGDYRLSPLIFGVDVARFGGDACVIQPRQGLAAFAAERIVGIDNMTFASRLHRARRGCDRPSAAARLSVRDYRSSVWRTGDRPRAERLFEPPIRDVGRHPQMAPAGRCDSERLRADQGACRSDLHIRRAVAPETGEQGHDPGAGRFFARPCRRACLDLCRARVRPAGFLRRFPLRRLRPADQR